MTRLPVSVRCRHPVLNEDCHTAKSCTGGTELATPQNGFISHGIAMLLQHAQCLEEKRQAEVDRRQARTVALIEGFNAIYEQERHKQNALSMRAHREQLRRIKPEGLGGSADEIYERIWELMDEGRERLEETGAQRLKRLKSVNSKIVRLWKVNKRAVEEGQPRYVDGLPVRMMMRPPMVDEARVKFVSAGHEACLACSAKRMRCSWEKSIEGQERVDGWAKTACSRCRRNGTACLVKRLGNELECPDGGRDGKLLEIAADGRLVAVDKGCFAPVMS